MRLKRLEAYGFKSFADRLTFDFEPGITAIIGPNGCGKSNVVDAIKWVVGEQSAKALRGGEMSDVIFNGCATRRPMPFCEVTLTLEDAATLSGGDDEVAITRRLSRDGQSGYYLNGRPCRLKDIRDLLIGTGIGTSAYSTIEQGRIGFILEASVKERRLILEEASGISRYKAQRKLALRKLERVQADLERIGQVLGEVEKQVRSVRRQAEKALRFQELSERLRELRMVFALEEYGRLQHQLAELREQIATCIERESSLAGRLGALDAILAEADTTLIDIDRRLHAAEEERSAVQSRRDVAATSEREARHRLVEIDQQEADDRTALAQHNDKVSALQEQCVAERQQLANTEQSDDDDQGLDRLYQQRRAERDRILAVIDRSLALIEEHKSREVDTLRELTRVAADLAHSTARGDHLQRRRNELHERNQGHDAILVTARQIETDCQATLAQAQETVDAGHAQLDALIRQREEAQGEAQSLESQLADLRHEEARAETRHRILADLESRAEGVSSGARGILKHMDRFPGIRGLVADLFQVEERFELAIETALGGQAQNIIAETQEAAQQAIAFLKRERRGRATFLPLDDLDASRGPDPQLLREPGVIGIARDLIRFDKAYTPAFDQLLGNILVCDNLDDAIALRRRQRPRCRLVTLEGDIVQSGGAMTGGRHQSSGGGGLVSRKNEIRRLEERLATLGSERQRQMEARDQAKKRAFECSLQVEGQRQTIHNAERALSEAKAQMMKAERDRLHAEEFASGFERELTAIAEEITTVAAERAALLSQQTTCEQHRTTLEAELARLQEDLRGQSAERDSVQEEVNSLQVNLATTAERREALRNHIAHLQRQLDDLADTKREREERLAALARKRAELTQVADENTAIHHEAATRFDSLSQTVTDLRRERDAICASVEEQRQESRTLTQQRRTVEQDHQRLELQAGEQRVRAESLNERILELYDIDLGEAYGHWQRPESLDWPNLRRELENTEREVARLGPVNLAAIDELKEVEARYDFLAASHTDLAEAATKLQQIIDDINDTSRALFAKTYREVRRNFQDLFRKLFGGGKADLVLESGVEDILEAGIDIIAQPPGKHPKNISLLSGGEKALTAVALLFAVYMTKPSPFCILDEVDAPLDESNTDVYCQQVREFVAKSQFLVITHNKRTMQYADALYGITHAEQGVSSKISVKLEELDAYGELVETTRGSGPFAD